MWRKILVVWLLLASTAPLLAQAYPLTRLSLSYPEPTDLALIGVYVQTDGYWAYTDAIQPWLDVGEAGYTTPTGAYVLDWCNPQYRLFTWRFLAHSPGTTAVKVVVAYLENVGSDWGIIGYAQSSFRKAFADYLNGMDFEARLRYYLANPPAQVCWTQAGPKNPQGCFTVDPAKASQVKVVGVQRRAVTVAPDKTLDLSELPSRRSLDAYGWRSASDGKPGFTPTHSYVVVGVYQGSLTVTIDYPYYSPAVGAPEEAVSIALPWWLLVLAGLVTTLLYFIYKSPRTVIA
jgi:hypothetical protein